jgi:hypothetical protein
MSDGVRRWGERARAAGMRPRVPWRVRRRLAPDTGQLPLMPRRHCCRGACQDGACGANGGRSGGQRWQQVREVRRAGGAGW